MTKIRVVMCPGQPGHEGENMAEIELKHCPFCGGEVEERGWECNYYWNIMVIDIECRKCGTVFKFKSRWKSNPYEETAEAWNRRADHG